MRALVFATAALLAVPAAAQDHSGHGVPAAQGAHSGHAGPVPEPEPQVHAHDHSTHAAPAADAHAGHADHAAHGAVAQPEARAEDHSAHGAADHSQMDHSAMDHSAMDHSAMGHGSIGHGAASAPPASGPPPRAFEGPAHAADVVFGPDAMEPARAALAHEGGGMTFGLAMIERLEARIGNGADGWLWDAQAWYGGDINRLWLKSEGDADFHGNLGHAEAQALWSHAIGPWFDFQAGVRYDIEPRSRAHAVIGLQGLAPYMFEVDAAAFLSDKGDLTAKAEIEYDQRLTQRLILQPRAEVALAAQDVPDLDLGSGFTSVELGARLRYEFAREFAPYVGVAYEAKLGRTADIARAAGDDPGRFVLLLGLRTWF